MHTIIIDLSCFFLARIFRSWEQSGVRDFIPEELAAMAIARITQEINPHADVVIASQDMDTKASVWQQKVSPEYRTRVSRLDEKILELGNSLTQTIGAMGIPIVRFKHRESDDTSAKIAWMMAGQSSRLTIVSNSLRLLPFVDHGIEIREPFGLRRTKNWCNKKYGIAPHQMPDYLALVGCSRFSGVPQIGKKRASGMLRSWDSIEKIVGLPGSNACEINRVKRFAYLALTNKVMACPEGM